MTYYELFCDFGIFAALIAILVIGVLALMAIAYGAICVLAWIEDEALRFISKMQRKARMRARAAENRAKLDSKTASIPKQNFPGCWIISYPFSCRSSNRSSGFRFTVI